MRKPKCYSRKMTKDEATAARNAVAKEVPGVLFLVQFCKICSAYHVNRKPAGNSH